MRRRLRLRKIDCVENDAVDRVRYILVHGCLLSSDDGGDGQSNRLEERGGEKQIAILCKMS
jgi:hypothetical protein